MVSGPTPSSTERGPGSEQLEAARGAVRDALGAIRNVEQLLRSIKVGPKALASVIPDVHASCAPLLRSFEVLLGAISPQEPSASGSLSGYVTPRIRDLEQALRMAMAGPLNAKQRLALEQAVTRISGELDAARALVELLNDAVSAPSARVQLVELVEGSFKADPGEPDAGERITATLGERDNVELQVNPRVAVELIAIGVGLVAARMPGRSPSVAIQSHGERCGVHVSPTGPGGQKLMLVVPRLIEPTIECARAAAQATQGTMSWDAGGPSLSLLWTRIRDE